jgi:hypothetical protein
VVIGFATGALVGSAVVVLGVRSCQVQQGSGDGPPCALGYGFLPLVALVGGAAGGLVGVIAPGQNWRRVW